MSTANKDDKAKTLQRLLHLNAERLEQYVRYKLPFELRSRLEPNDVLQDVFFEVFRRVEEFDPSIENPYRWLVTIARHRILMLIRSERAAKRGGNKAGRGIDLSEVESMIEELAVYSRTPSQSAISHEVAMVVQKSLNSLHPLHKEVIQLRYIRGLSAEESAEKMGRSQAAIFMLCRRGLKSLKSQLVEAGAFSNL